MAKLQLLNLNIHYGDFHAVKGVDLEVDDSEIVTLLGPSGCGKTSILRAIAGFNIPSDGQVIMNGVDITYDTPQRRNMGMIFQNYALWPHMSVGDNIGYGLKVRGFSKEKRNEQIERLVHQVQLEGQQDKFPGQLSGGQQQRVSLARALAIEPKILLCDEPLSNLDFKLRVELRTEIRNIANDFGVTVIYVTHDQTEALAISDKIAVMHEGLIVQVGTPEEIYSDPDNHFVGKFVGENNLLEGKITGISGKEVEITLGSGDTISVQLQSEVQKDQTVKLIIRQDMLKYVTGPGKNTVTGKLRYRAYMGNFVQAEIEMSDGSAVMANIDEDMEAVLKIERGAGLSYQVIPEEVFVFRENGERIR